LFSLNIRAASEFAGEFGLGSQSNDCQKGITTSQKIITSCWSSHNRQIIFKSLILFSMGIKVPRELPNTIMGWDAKEWSQEDGD